MISNTDVRISLPDGSELIVTRQDIRDTLTHGGQSKMARMACVTRASVSQWFKGRISSRAIEEAAIKLYCEELGRVTRMRNQLTAALGLTPAQ